MIAAYAGLGLAYGWCLGHIVVGTITGLLLGIVLGWYEHDE